MVFITTDDVCCLQAGLLPARLVVWNCTHCRPLSLCKALWCLTMLPCRESELLHLEEPCLPGPLQFFKGLLHVVLCLCILAHLTDQKGVAC